VAKLTKPKDSKALATFCAKIAAEKIATNIIVMDLANYETAPTDFFVICSSDSENQSRAIADFLLRQTKNVGLSKPKVEGDTVGDWILIDFFDVVMHVMLTHIRDYYEIEKLWSDAIFYKFNIETSKLNKVQSYNMNV
jgi:ribosome-associated protein